MIILPNRRKAFRGGAASTLLDGLQAWWEMDSTGNQADQTGNGNTATAVGSPTVASAGGPGGRDAVALNGSSQYYTVPHSDDMVFGGGVDWSFGAWAWEGASPVNYGSIIDKRTGTDEVGLSGNPSLDLRYIGASGVVGLTSAFSSETWFFTVLTYTASTKTVRHYLNGSATPTKTQVEGSHASANTNAANIGRYVGDGYWWKGRLSQMAKWSRPLTTDEIAELYNSGAGLSYADL